MAHSLASYLVSIMLTVLPPGGPGAHGEGAAAGAARYQSIAADVSHAVSTGPCLPGHHGCSRLGVLMLAIAYHESAWRVDVDQGKTLDSGGTSWGLWQINVGRGKTAEGWTGPELVRERWKGAISALHLVRLSAIACRKEGHLAMLRAYTSGSCDRGGEASKTRVSTADRWLARFPPKD